MRLTLKWWPNRGRNHTGSRTEPKSELTKTQWFLIADLFENPDPSPAGGRPPVDPRRCFGGFAWVLRTGARWKDLPKRFPSPATCWRRHFEWTERGLLEEAGAATGPAGTTETRRSVRGRHVCERKKGGEAIGLTKRGNGSKFMLLVDGHGTPLSVLVASASLGETSLLEPLLDQSLSPRQPTRLICDRELDSDVHCERLRQRGIELVCPHRKNRTRSKRPDGRALRCFTRRWKIERTNSWLHNVRRIVVRHERLLIILTGFAQLACLLTVLRRF
jgi:transposase